MNQFGIELIIYLEERGFDTISFHAGYRSLGFLSSKNVPEYGLALQ